VVPWLGCTCGVRACRRSMTKPNDTMCTSHSTLLWEEFRARSMWNLISWRANAGTTSDSPRKIYLLQWDRRAYFPCDLTEWRQNLHLRSVNLTQQHLALTTPDPLWHPPQWSSYNTRRHTLKKQQDLRTIWPQHARSESPKKEHGDQALNNMPAWWGHPPPPLSSCPVTRFTNKLLTVRQCQSVPCYLMIPNKLYYYIQKPKSSPFGPIVRTPSRHYFDSGNERRGRRADRFSPVGTKAVVISQAFHNGGFLAQYPRHFAYVAVY
jgi:hypothetical protein